MAQLPATLSDSPAPSELTEHERSQLWHSLTGLQQAWLQEYLSNGFNATQAAKDAGYKASSEVNFRKIGSENKNHPKIGKLIASHMSEQMGVNEAMSRLAALARGDMSDMLYFDDEGEAVIDLQKAKERGVLHRIKKLDLERTEDPETGEVTTTAKVKLYDQRKVLKDILDILGAGDDEEGGGDTFQQFNYYLDQHHKGEESPFSDVDNQL